MPSENVMEEAVGDEAVDADRMIRWAGAMREWLLRYESHIEEFCTTKQIPKPPQW